MPSVWDVFLAPSPPDLSVRVGHGGSDDEVVCELSRGSERAKELGERDRGP